MKLYLSQNETPSQNKSPAVSQYSLDYLQRRIEFLHQRFGDYVALNFVQITSEDGLNVADLPFGVEKELLVALKSQLHPRSAVINLGAGVYSILYVGVDALDSVDWLSQGQLNHITSGILVGGHKYMFNAKSGVSSLRLSGVDRNNLIESASCALDYSDFGRSVAYPRVNNQENRFAA